MYSPADSLAYRNDHSDAFSGILERLSSLIGAPLALNDSDMVPVASMPHEGALDRSRLELLMGRTVPHEVGQVLTGREKILTSQVPKRIAPFSGLELGRIHVPLRSHAGTVGHLWVVDPEHRSDVGALPKLQEQAERALTAPLDQIAKAKGGDSQLAEELVRAGHAGEKWTRTLLLRLLPKFPIFAQGASVELWHETLHQGIAEHLGIDLNQVLVRQHDSGDYLVSAVGETRQLTLAKMTKALLAVRNSQSAKGAGFPQIAGAVTPILPSETRVHWRDVALTLMVEIALNGVHPEQDVHLLADDDLFDLLTELGPMVEGRENWVPPSVTRLLSDPRGPVLAATAKTFLDLGGSIAKTAQQVSVHRGTLYYRLEQVEEITGLRLEDGRHRLLLHLGLILSEIHGMMRAA